MADLIMDLGKLMFARPVHLFDLVDSVRVKSTSRAAVQHFRTLATAPLTLGCGWLRLGPRLMFLQIPQEHAGHLQSCCMSSELEGPSSARKS